MFSFRNFQESKQGKEGAEVVFEEAELSTVTKINQTMQSLAVIANKPHCLYHLSFPPRPFKFKTVIALSTFAGIDLAINCFCGKILF